MSEQSAVQNPLLKYAEQIGWQLVPPSQAVELRGGAAGQFFLPILSAQLARLNPGVINGERAAEVTRRLRLLSPTIEGNREALKWLRGEMSVYVAEQKQERNVRLIDFENLDNNIFQVTPEWRHQGRVPPPNRADAVFLINGIPVVLAELKAAEKTSAVAEGVEQVRRYHRETPEMLTHPQVFEVSQRLALYYGPTWNVSRKNLFNWREDAPDAVAYEAKVKGFFQRERIVRVLKEYVLFLSKDDILSKVLLRQHQTRAVEKVVARVLDPKKRKGLLWHTQGSGKTLTMITIAANLLRGAIDGEKPTVLMIVDRNELEAQLFANITAYGITQPMVADNKRELRDLLASDYRGLIVSMIHKFDDIPADINTRHGIVILVDEAHRSTQGDFGNYLMAALPNATYIGFTGTPIDGTSQGKATFKTFGMDDEKGYLDKYSIAESIEDGTTVPLNYALAPSNLLINRDLLEKEFLSLTDSEGVSDVEELNAILDRAVDLKQMMKSQTRVENVAAFVAEHFRLYVEPMGFKAFLVAVDREACTFYKEALDKYLPPDASRVVISLAHNDRDQLKRHYLDENQEKEVRRNFIQRDKQPQILIVTEKLLTGFDAPILYCLYLDKPMRDHVLLQTIARVNRPYEDESGSLKPGGFVLDFVGILERLEKALAFDSDVVASVIQNIDVLNRLFETMLKELGPEYLDLARSWDDKAKERAIEYFRDKERRETFYRFHKQVATLYEILSPDPFLRPYISDHQSLTVLYCLIRNAYSPRVYADKELTSKTQQLLRQTTSATAIELPNKIHQLGVAELAVLKRADDSDTMKILNLRKALAVTVEAESTTKPFVVSIGERAETLAQAYEDRHQTTREVLAAFEKLAQEYVESAQEYGQLGVDENTFAIYKTLKPFTDDVTPAQAQAVNTLFADFPDYAWDVQQQSKLRAALYRALRPLVGGQMIAITNTLLRLKMIPAPKG